MQTPKRATSQRTNKNRDRIVKFPERALIFDMDGVLIDSEPFWRRSEIEVFGSVGLVLSDSDCRQTQGLRMDAVAQHWFERAPWTGPSPDEVAAAVVRRVQTLIETEGVPITGVSEAIAAARKGQWRLGLASSSAMRLIETVITCLELTETFETLCSAEFEKEGKPHPAVYQSALRALQIDGRRAVAIEDSPSGVEAAKAAGMHCIAIPETGSLDDPRLSMADWRLDSLSELPELLATLEQEEAFH